MVIRQKECALTEICIITNTVKYVMNTTVVRLDRCKYDLNLDTFLRLLSLLAILVCIHSLRFCFIDHAFLHNLKEYFL